MQIDPINAMAKRLNETAWSRYARDDASVDAHVCRSERENVQRQEVFYFHMKIEPNRRQSAMQ